MADLDAELDAAAEAEGDFMEEDGGTSVGLRFCRECNMMLYPKEDFTTKKLIYKCISQHNDGYEEESTSPYVYRNNIVASDTSVNLDVIPTDIITDPTLRRQATTCPACGHDEAVVLQANAGPKSKKLSLIFCCTATDCRHKWLSVTG